QLESRLSQIEGREAETVLELARAQAARSEAEAALEKQNARDKRALGGEAQKLFEELRSARGDLDRAKKLLRKQKLEQDDLREVQQRIEDAATKSAKLASVEAEIERGEVAAERLAVGNKVYVPRLRAEAEAALEKQTVRDKRALGGEAQKLFEELRSARGDLDRAKKLLRKQKLEQDDVREVQQRIDAAAAKSATLAQAEVHTDRAEVALERLTVGSKVYVPRLRAEVEIVEAPSKGKLRVAAGAMRLWVDVSEIREGAPKEEERPASKLGRGPARPATRSSDNTIVLRGMRVDDALTLLESSLDRLYGRDETVAFIDHGVGSGALRDAVRSYFERPSPYVASARPGTVEEGGERLTVVTFR
ncbi:MAG: Smr/MutS family protein, partial [Polyangiales bacterium]